METKVENTGVARIFQLGGGGGGGGGKVRNGSEGREISETLCIKMAFLHIKCNCRVGVG